ncbi:MAG: Na+/proline symporter [Roseivirga sp.]|jgi:Na+/proline symporter
MSYFGTDQSQVQRYLSGKTLSESRLGLMMNGLLKVPMQFIILLIGVLVFVYYQYNQPPIFFNENLAEQVMSTEYADDFKDLEKDYMLVFDTKRETIFELNAAIDGGDESVIADVKAELNALQLESDELRAEAKALVGVALPEAETNDKDYIFMTYVMKVFPVGVVGLLFAVIFSAAMSSTSSELNALGSTTTIDFYKRKLNQNQTDDHYLKSSKIFTLAWGVLAIIFASTLSLFDNLIQAVNLIGSLFYPTVLGIFVVAFFFKKIRSNATFIGAILSQIVIMGIHYMNVQGTAGPFTMGFLWYNALGCILVVLFSMIINILTPQKA